MTLVSSFLSKATKLKILVIGDVMLDKYIWGNVDRISPEAPVPVVEVSRDSEVPGGAGNVAVNMAALGAQVYVLGMVGNDNDADRLFGKLRDAQVATECCIRADDRPTIVKTRIIAHHQQVVRFDREKKTDLTTGLRDRLWTQIQELLPKIDCVVISDYAKGVISDAHAEDVIATVARLEDLGSVRELMDLLRGSAVKAKAA